MIARFVIGWAGDDPDVSTTQHAIPNGGGTWGTSQQNKQFTMPTACTHSLLTANLTANANTVNGATITVEEDDAVTPLVLTIDQATGKLQELTLRAATVALAEINYTYTEGDSTIDVQ